MTVKELIEELSKLPQDLPIAVPKGELNSSLMMASLVYKSTYPRDPKERATQIILIS